MFYEIPVKFELEDQLTQQFSKGVEGVLKNINVHSKWYSKS